VHGERTGMKRLKDELERYDDDDDIVIFAYVYIYIYVLYWCIGKEQA
jgi:hypothetical protein